MQFLRNLYCFLEAVMRGKNKAQSSNCDQMHQKIIRLINKFSCVFRLHLCLAENQLETYFLLIIRFTSLPKQRNTQTGLETRFRSWRQKGGFESRNLESGVQSRFCGVAGNAQKTVKSVAKRQSNVQKIKKNFANCCFSLAKIRQKLTQKAKKNYSCKSSSAN